ncbi:MAG: family 43 glycosylhydrolase, partial [Bacteroidota bacterium]
YCTGKMKMKYYSITVGVLFTTIIYSQEKEIKYPKATGNPLVTHIRTADPSVRIWVDGKLWMYASHDMDDATNYNSMDGYHVFSTTDLINWIDHGEVLHSRNVSWGTEEGGWMWAPDCAYKNGKYYFYFPHRKLFNGKCVLIVKSVEQAGQIKINASSEGLQPAEITISTK